MFGLSFHPLEARQSNLSDVGSWNSGFLACQSADWTSYFGETTLRSLIMSAQIIDHTEAGFTIQITISYNRSMLDFEENLQQRLNEAGVLATREGLRQFDTDGSPITVGATKLTSKGP